MAQRIVDQEIFAVGTWNGDKYTEGDLDAMVSAFNTLKMPVPLKLGHTEAQKWFGQEDGAPALGWVEGVRRIGKKLVADFANVPDVLASLIANRNYRSKSAEIFWNFISHDGQKWPRALKAVSLLGADMPAVTTLDDLQAVLMSANSYSISNAVPKWMTTTDGTSTITYKPEWKAYDLEEDQMDKEAEKKYTDRIAVLEGNVTSEKDRAEKAEARAVLAEASLSEKDEKHSVDQFGLEVDGLVKDGKVLPKEKEGLVRQFVALGAGKKKYGDKEFNPREELVASLKTREKIISLGERGAGGELDGDDVPAAVKVHKLAEKHQRDLKIDYSAGITKVREEEPALWKEYMNSGKGGE